MEGRKETVMTDSLAVARTSLRFDWSELDEGLLRRLLGGWCRTGVYGVGVIDSDGREWFNGCSSFCQSCWW